MIRAGSVAALLVLLAGSAAAQTIEARFDRRTVALGETTTLRVIVRGGGGVKEPTFDLPDELAVASSSRQQSFAWVNGRASAETEFLYEIEALAPGTFAIGPILVAVGSQAYRSGQLQLTVVEAPSLSRGGGGEGEAPATLAVDVRPRQPYVGQEVSLVVRLVQRASFAEDPQYTPPTTTGFWTDRASPPESFYGNERGERVLVTETRTRLYPLAVGEATIGPAEAMVVLASDGGDPFGWLRGNQRRRVLRSRPVAVRVLPLPGGAPADFGGAVGRFEAAWSGDRSRTSRDVPITLRLDVRGRGNLPLVRAPQFGDSEVEVLASTVDDSLAPPGVDGNGRKRFQWTVLPRREGRLELRPPRFSWFDPTVRTYRTVAIEPLAIEVGPPVFSGSGPEAGFPRELADRPIDPAARPAEPWGFALAGIALGAARIAWSRGGRPRPGSQEAQAWMARLKGAAGADVWRAAEECTAWLESRSPSSDPELAEMRRRIAAARYGGARENPKAIRGTLLARVRGAASAGGGGVSMRLLAVGLVVAAIALGWAFGPRPGDGRAAGQSAAADQAARRGEVAKARSVWLELWRVHGGHPGLAARLAWASVQAGEIGPAALWVMRGDLVEPRDPGLEWVEDRVREGGGLIGASSRRWPIRRLEWGALALALGLMSGVAWPRRAAVTGLALLACAVAAVAPLQGWLAARSGDAVTLASASMEGSDIELDPGQMVVIHRQVGPRALVSAGRVVRGWVPSGTVERIVPTRGAGG